VCTGTKRKLKNLMKLALAITGNSNVTLLETAVTNGLTAAGIRFAYLHIG